ncbi:MAG: hypothetical protein KJ814_01810 [Proteobacteria bacterium]|nr:hypothetical protein [Pseudomonadota bacterium]
MNDVKDSCNKHHYDRTLEGRLPKDWQSLEAHLKNAAELAHSFADEFGAGEWGHLAGL